MSFGEDVEGMGGELGRDEPEKEMKSRKALEGLEKDG